MYGRERRTKKPSKARRRQDEKLDHDALRTRQAWFALHPPGHMFKSSRPAFGAARPIQLFVLVAWYHRTDPTIDLWAGDPKNYGAILLPFGGGSIEHVEWNDFGTKYVDAWVNQPS